MYVAFVRIVWRGSGRVVRISIMVGWGVGWGLVREVRNLLSVPGR